VERWLYFLPDHGVSVCRRCGHGIRPDRGIARHLRSLHKDLSRQDRKALIEHCAILSLAEPDTVLIPAPDSAAIQGLTVFNGLACTACDYTCVSEKAMHKHCKLQHEWVKTGVKRKCRHSLPVMDVIILLSLQCANKIKED